MMSPADAKRIAALRLSQAIKELFMMVPVPRSWAWRAVFLAEDGKTMRRAAGQVLEHLRYFCFADRSIFGGSAGREDSAFLLGVREGRRQVWLEMMKYLKLDEGQVRSIMENDDGY